MVTGYRLLLGESTPGAVLAASAGFRHHARVKSFRTRISWLAGFALVPLACSSDEGGGGGGPYAPPGNGVPMNEAEACAALQDAESDKRNALACGPVTLPACPGYLRKANEPCLEYDQGTVSGCVAYIASLSSCDALKTYQCVVKALPGTAPNGCPPPPDGGIDAPVDTGTDAPADTGTDAPADTGTDAPADTGADATLDAGTDAASDAASD